MSLREMNLLIQDNPSLQIGRLAFKPRQKCFIYNTLITLLFIENVIAYVE